MNWAWYNHVDVDTFSEKCGQSVGTAGNRRLGQRCDVSAPQGRIFGDKTSLRTSVTLRRCWVETLALDIFPRGATVGEAPVWADR